MKDYSDTYLFSCFSTVNVVDFCGQTIKGDGMVVNSHKDSKKYYFVTMGTDCHLTMQAASPRDKIQFHFRFFLVYSLLRVAPLSPAPPSPRGSAPLDSPRPDPGPGQGPEDPCHAGSYLQFYDGRERSSPPVGPPLCGKSPPRPVLSTGDYLTLRLVTRGTQPRVDFVGDFTSFRLGFNQSECSGEPYFTCRNGKCIPLSLVCDDKGIDNCGDGSDLEENLTSGCKGGQLVAHTSPPTIATSAGASVLTTAPASTGMNCGAPDSAHNLESATASTVPVSLLALYVALGVLGAALLLCWCCWSPAWFLWRFSVCRHLPCCNATCSACQLCLRGCGHHGENRPIKVTPHNPVSGTLLRPVAPDANVSSTTVAV
ncbi:low-density lipoprotein receptor class A domain-containing protein 2 [Gadus chalcogrammus]|uniref:low-density lipoprotein receptor class A domain-containing protein 2 n=1 Tax=Gadus chalcogrammus TaxID=1042646 RepID=UPI0024C27B01|nr:low-density lipoprotein receptor class A domain-containing protein 2 [Gadus chalcogrammus]